MAVSNLQCCACRQAGHSDDSDPPGHDPHTDDAERTGGHDASSGRSEEQSDDVDDQTGTPSTTVTRQKHPN